MHRKVGCLEVVHSWPDRRVDVSGDPDPQVSGDVRVGGGMAEGARIPAVE